MKSKYFSNIIKVVLAILAVFPNRTIQVDLDPNEFVDPPGYPFTSMDYIRIADSFYGGFKMYEQYPVSKLCMDSMESKYMTLEYTFKVWTEVNFLNPNFTKYNNTSGEPLPNIYSEPLDIQVYNLSEATSQYFAPIFTNCSLFQYRFFKGTYDHY